MDKEYSDYLKEQARLIDAKDDGTLHRMALEMQKAMEGVLDYLNAVVEFDKLQGHDRKFLMLQVNTICSGIYGTFAKDFDETYVWIDDMKRDMAKAELEFNKDVGGR